jgi:hypothetical protein
MEQASARRVGADVEGGGAAVRLPSRAVFVVGAARSGTTLMARLLDGHPDLFVLPRESHATWCIARPDPVAALVRETPLAREFAGDERRLEDFARRLGRRLTGRLDVSRLLRALAETWLEERPPARPLSAWVEKTPRHLRHVPELLAAFGPQTRFVALLRDPRAVMASRAMRFGRRGRHAVRHFAHRWATAAELLKRFEQLPQMLVVRYGDLVRTTGAQMRRVALHLGLHWDDVLLTPQRAGRAWEGNSTFECATHGVHANSLDRWRVRLQPGEIRELEDLLRDRMTARGYPPVCGGGFSLARWLLLEPAVAMDLWRLRRAWLRAGAR